MRIDSSHLSKLTPHQSTLAQQARPVTDEVKAESSTKDGRVAPSSQLSRKVAELRVRLQALDASKSDTALSVIRRKIAQGGFDTAETARQTAEALVARWFPAAD